MSQRDACSHESRSPGRTYSPAGRPRWQLWVTRPSQEAGGVGQLHLKGLPVTRPTWLPPCHRYGNSSHASNLGPTRRCREVQRRPVGLLVPQKPETRALRMMQSQPQNHTYTQKHNLFAWTKASQFSAPVGILLRSHARRLKLMRPTPSHTQRGEEPPHNKYSPGKSDLGRPCGSGLPRQAPAPLFLFGGSASAGKWSLISW